MRQPSSSATVVMAGPLDVPVIATLYEATLNDAPWGESAIKTLLSAGGGFAHLASGRAYGEVMPQGFSLGRVVADEAELLAMGVLPDAQRMGIAGRLLESALETAQQRGARRMTLEVRDNNTAAFALYSSKGFEVVGHRPHYYESSGSGSEGARLLARNL